MDLLIFVCVLTAAHCAFHAIIALCELLLEQLEDESFEALGVEEPEVGSAPENWDRQDVPRRHAVSVDLNERLIFIYHPL